METRICPHCNKSAYSSRFDGRWICPNCYEEIQEKKEGGKLMAGMTVKIQCADIEEVKVIVDQLKSENTRLKLQLGKVLEALGIDYVDVPCPSNVGLNDSHECGLTAECPQCWRDALDEFAAVTEDQDGPLSPPEIADMHQDGTLCNQCGEYIGEPEVVRGVRGLRGGAL